MQEVTVKYVKWYINHFPKDTVLNMLLRISKKFFVHAKTDLGFERLCKIYEDIEEYTRRKSK